MSGGLGNQLFQYATALQIAKNNSLPLLLDVSSFSSFSIRSFCIDKLIPSVSIISKEYVKTLVEPSNIISKKVTDFFGWRRLPKIVETKKGFDSQIAKIDIPCYLKGSFISFKYFESINEDFINSIVFSEMDKSAAIESMIQYVDYNIVCVSIRRGDFLKYPSLNVCTKEFYLRSIDRARELLFKPTFLFFSDDINWVRETFVASDFRFWDVKNYSLTMKLYAMNMCNHYVISNSSYSWWGAWLNQSITKKVFCSSKVENDGSFPIDDYYPSSWIRINP
jgi:hypothetical protein